jgi:hypothetical protein
MLFRENYDFQALLLLQPWHIIVLLVSNPIPPVAKLIKNAPLKILQAFYTQGVPQYCFTGKPSAEFICMTNNLGNK